MREVPTPKTVILSAKGNGFCATNGIGMAHARTAGIAHSPSPAQVIVETSIAYSPGPAGTPLKRADGGPLERTALIPRGEVTIVDSAWNVLGLRDA